MSRFASTPKLCDAWMNRHLQASWFGHNCRSKYDSDIQLKRGYFYWYVKGLCCKFKGTLLNSNIATKLFQTYCCSFYGSLSGNLSNSTFEYICTAWNKVEWRSFYLPYRRHCYFLPFIVQTSHIRNQLVESFRRSPVCGINYLRHQWTVNEITVKPVCNDHLYYKIYYLWLIQ